MNICTVCGKVISPSTSGSCRCFVGSNGANIKSRNESLEYLVKKLGAENAALKARLVQAEELANVVREFTPRDPFEPDPESYFDEKSLFCPYCGIPQWGEEHRPHCEWLERKLLLEAWDEGGKE